MSCRRSASGRRRRRRPGSRISGAASASSRCAAARSAISRRRTRGRRRQPVSRHRAGVHRRAETEVAACHRSADQHASSRRSHGGQQGVPRGGEIDRRARELGAVAEESGRAGEDRGRSAGRRVHSQLDHVLETVPKQHSDDTIYIFGHGKAEFGVTGRKAELAKFRDYLTAALDHTWKQTAAGKTRRTSSRFKRCPASTSTRRRRRPSSRSAAS